MTPLGQGGGPGLFENIAAVEMAFVVEVVVDRGMNGGEFLQGLYVFLADPGWRSAYETLPDSPNEEKILNPHGSQ